MADFHPYRKWKIKRNSTRNGLGKIKLQLSFLAEVLSTWPCTPYMDFFISISKKRQLKDSSVAIPTISHLEWVLARRSDIHWAAPILPLMAAVVQVRPFLTTSLHF